jgi:hypothetical protein
MGKGTVVEKDFEGTPISSQMVLSLMKPFFGKGYCVTTDNFYTSHELAEALISRQMILYGIVHANEKGCLMG